ncbi:MAG: ATP-binding protein [Planctomycetota bacterium]|nr:ATP-binding protein [Planctomycetota bacterium]
MSSLFVIKGLDQGKKFELSGSLCRLGRDNENSILVNDREASRRHAEISQLDEKTFELVDLDSSNGTFVNDSQVKRHVLKNGDRVRIGKTVLIFTLSSSAPELNRSDLVKIVQRPLPESASRIVSSLVADGARSARQLMTGGEEQERLASPSLDLVYRTALEVSQTLDIDQLIEKLMNMIFEAIEPDRGCILMYDAESAQMIPRITRSKMADRETDELEISRSIVDYVVEKKEGILTSDAVNDERWTSNASILNMGVSEAICVPMQGRYETQGVIYVDTRTPPGKIADLETRSKLTIEHLKLMIAIGHQAALAIEDTNFYSAMIHSERMAAMGQTIATLSHHIKNILQGINGGSYLVRNGITDSKLEVVETGWKIVEKNQEKISQLVMDMLSFSKEREPDLEMGDLNQTLSDVVELMLHRAQEREIEIHWQPNPQLPHCLFDAEGIHRATLNVLSNAIDALEQAEGSEAGEVKIETLLNSEKNRVEIWIADNGEGIEAENLDRIFGVFESGKGQRGTGLGLPVSRKIMNEHEGDIYVESEIGEGSRFCLFFPIQAGTIDHPTRETGLTDHAGKDNTSSH